MIIISVLSVVVAEPNGDITNERQIWAGGNTRRACLVALNYTAKTGHATYVVDTRVRRKPYVWRFERHSDQPSEFQKLPFGFRYHGRTLEPFDCGNGLRAVHCS